MYIFGGQIYSSERYAEVNHHLVKIKLMIIEDKIKTEIIESRSIDVEALPILSEMEIIKLGNKTFALGGYGAQFSSIFFPVSEFFYELNLQ